MFQKLSTMLSSAISSNSVAGAAPDYIQASLSGLQSQTAAHSQTWSFGSEESWAADLELGEITFTFSNGNVATTDIQVVGTYNTEDGSFMWAWDHPSVPEQLRAHSLLARQWGEENKQVNFTQRKVQCSENEAWEFSAVTNRLANANGVYRGPAGTALVFFTLGEIKLEKKTP
ncbi:MAG TPA: hypothetical protein PK002_13715 [Cellvibrio sp.]|nr:hypothetical protein [Cellvibrio sp.]